MAIPVWPASLPQELLMSGYQQSVKNNLLRTQMEAGPAKVRRRGGAYPEPVQGRQMMTKPQFENFRIFYITTLEDGSLRFSWIEPLSKVAAEFRFTSPPNWAISGGFVDVSLQLEILP